MIYATLYYDYWENIIKRVLKKYFAKREITLQFIMLRSGLLMIKTYNWQHC